MGAVNMTDQDLAEDLWQGCFDRFEDIVDKATYEMVIKNVKPVYRNVDTIELFLPWGWQKEKIEKYLDSINSIYSEKAGRKIAFLLSVGKNGQSENSHVEFSPGVGIEEPPKLPADTAIMDSQKRKSIKLDPKNTFDTFVVGNGNRIAAAAAQAVAEAPAKAYNPLFIYGGVGLGKTHLLHAIAHKVMKKNAESRIVYVPAENFMNDMVESIQDKKMKQFRRKYRDSNIFLIDDIQFIKNKELMQEEFFHTFNELYAAKSQIVITSDRPPKDIPTLEDRLRSRFEWGLIADIQPPELETRMAILKKKAETENVNVPNEVITYIAENIPSNIRELEGALNRVILFSSYSGRKIDLDLSIEALKEILPSSRPKHLTITFIQEKICEYYGIRLEDLLGSCRDSKLVLPRHIGMYLCRELLGASFPNIGKAFGGRDHTTIMNGYSKVNKKKRDPSVRNDLENIKNMLKKVSG
jgi:chromosomal replication initiator protein